MFLIKLANPREDYLNKPWRPIPSGLITVQNATRLRWILLFACFFHSTFYNPIVMLACLGIEFLTWWHHELGANRSHWLLRNAINGFGLGFFELGAVAVASGGTLPKNAMISNVLSVFIFTSTIHAQDFKDKEGDSLSHRKTLVLVAPRIARVSIMVGLPLWSALTVFVWRLDLRMAISLSSIAFYTGWRFFALRTVPEDQVSYYWYNAWITGIHLLPLLHSS